MVRLARLARPAAAAALRLLVSLVTLVAGPALAASYTFPGALPPGCSGSNGNYTCPAGTMGYGDTVTIASPKPATITVSGNVNLNSARINAGGSAGDLTLIVNGELIPGYQAVINANVVVQSFNDANGGVSIGGSLRATSGNVLLGYLTSVTGSIALDSGSLSAGANVVVGGGITASAGVTLGYMNQVGGPVSAGGAVDTGQSTTIAGNVSATAAGAVTVGYGASVTGNVLSSSGTVTLAQNAVVSACVQAGTGAGISLGVQAQASRVCCGSLGSCGNSCVSNGSGAAMPAVCTATSATLAARYDFHEAAWAGTAGELKDTAGYTGGPYNGRAKGSPLPTPATASPARSGSPGTCGYASLPGPASGGGGFTISSLPVSTTSGSQTTLAFWMYWDGGDWVMPVGFNTYDLIFGNGHFGFNTSNGDIYGVASTGLDNGWHHVVAVFTHGSVNGNQLWIDGVQQALAQRLGTPLASGAVVATTLQLGGWSRDTGYRFSGRIDQLRIYRGAVTASQVASLHAETLTCPSSTTLLARYEFDETAYNGTASELRDNAGHASGPFHGRAQGSPMPTTATASPARSGSPGSCRYAAMAGPETGGGAFVVGSLPVSTTAGAKTSVAFWMYWDGVTDGTPLSWAVFNLWFTGGNLGFNTGGSDLYGISSSGLALGWHHVVAVFSNGGVTGGKLYIDGVQQTLTQRSGTPTNSYAVVSSTLTIGGWGYDNTTRFIGRLDQVRVYKGELDGIQVATLYAETPSTCAPPLHHLEIQHASGTGLTCTPSTLTIRACQDAACTSLYTGGVTGTFSATGGSVSWPDGAGFSIPAGSSSATERVQVATTTATVLGATASSPVAASATTCNFGSPACTFTAADSGLLFDVPHHVAETTQSITVSAVKKSDSSLACTPAFASVTRNVGFSCSHTNPNSGTLPVRVGGTALNAAGNAAAACDGSSRTVSLAFNASGVASTTLQYADVGEMTLNATYTGSAATNDTGLAMTGTDSFIAAPDHFTISGVTAGPIRAGSSFSATVTARNAAGGTTPNHGRESAPQRAYIGWVRLQPTGNGASDGSFSGSGARSFSGGAVTASDLSWTEVGRGDLVVRGSDSNGYYGSGLHVFGSSAASGARHCAAEGGSCVLPGGSTATVYYGAPGGWAVKAGQTGTVACTNDNFGDPLWGTVKRCYYALTAASNGSVGDFIPQRFSVVAPNACGAFTYAGQPVTATVTALNAAGNTTLNFNGTATTTPVFAQAVTLSDANALGLGTLSGASIAASAFSAGAAASQVSYAFTSKATAPQSLLLRAGNGLSGASLVSSAGGTEATLALRSGRLRLSNAFGRATAALQLAAVTEYWSGNAWLLNSDDSCTALAGASVALSNPRSATGAASTATTSAGALAISNGSGTITLAAPSPAGSSLSLDLAVNLGSTGTDQSCHAAHPATTGAGKPWLRSLNGSCAAGADRDPAARASFGIFSPETRRTIHVRELF